MNLLIKALLGLILLIVVGGGIFLATWDIPPPSTTVERPIPDSRFRD